MAHNHSRYLRTLLISLLIVAAFIAGYYSGGSHHERLVFGQLMNGGLSSFTVDNSVSLRPVELFNEVLMRVQQEYVEPIKDPNELAYGAVRGMLSELKDPYTRFMDPKEYKDFTDDNVGHFAGIGATLNMVEVEGVKTDKGAGTLEPVVCKVCGTPVTDTSFYRVAVVEPLPKSPAEKAGVHGGDFILKIGDKSTDGMLVSEAAELIRGPEGSNVTLTLGRKGVEKPLEMTITRAQIEVPAVQTKVLDNNIGYLRIYSFNEKTVSETRAALMDFNKANVRGMVLDLRNNPGGLLTECIKVCSMLLPQDKKVIVSTKGRNGQTEPYNRVDRQLFDKPIVVLVNKGSASASEITSGCLKDYKRATLIGDTTYGKALVQTVVRLSGNSAMAVTTAHYYTPSGFDLNKKGIEPDVKVELDKSVKVINEGDNQAQTALRILKEEMAKQ